MHKYVIFVEFALQSNDRGQINQIQDHRNGCFMGLF